MLQLVQGPPPERAREFRWAPGPCRVWGQPRELEPARPLKLQPAGLPEGVPGELVQQREWRPVPRVQSALVPQRVRVPLRLCQAS